MGLSVISCARALKRLVLDNTHTRSPRVNQGLLSCRNDSGTWGCICPWITGAIRNSDSRCPTSLSSFWQAYTFNHTGRQCYDVRSNLLSYAKWDTQVSFVEE